MKQNLKNKIDELAGLLILLNILIIGTLCVAGFVFGFRMNTVKELLLVAIPLVIIVAITATVIGISKEGEE